MTTKTISYSKTGRFSNLILNYLNEDKRLQPFYSLFPTPENLYKQARLKLDHYAMDTRRVLCDVIAEQYKDISISVEVENNLNALQAGHTVTITTGHQLCLMTGPLFFIYKIVSVIKMCHHLSEKYPDIDLVPVYWMATEDHDFEEISSFIFQGKKIQWNGQAGDAVGRMTLAHLQDTLDLFEHDLGKNTRSESLKKIIQDSYRSATHLADATRRFVNALFSSYGLIIIDGDNSRLKQLFTPYLKTELTRERCQQNVRIQNEWLQKKYDNSFKPQVTPRNINLFYLDAKGRYRIEKKEGRYLLNGHSKTFTEDAILKELNNYPERFSPNVLLRPLYQEVILPNICYIGGGGELSYWFQLKRFFDDQKVLFPALALRNSALLMNAKMAKKVLQLNVKEEELFLKKSELINRKVKEISAISLDLSFLKKRLEEQFDYLDTLVQKTEASFAGALAAQRAKQLKGIAHLEKRLLKAQKRKLNDYVNRIETLHETLFPNNTLQERQLNFTDFYMEMGADFIPLLIKSFEPFQYQFNLIEY